MTGKTDELLPCPFCGRTDFLRIQSVGSLTVDMPSRPYRVVCGNTLDCENVAGPTMYGQTEARAAWNRRAPAQPAVKCDWHRVDSDSHILLYTLLQDGWRKGEAVMVNDVMVRVEQANRSQTPIEPIATTILSALVSAPADPGPAPADERPWVARIAEVLDEGDGFWRSCSGCHELVEGVPTGEYSAAFRSHIGLGCSECGGLGVIWDTTDYGAMASSMLQEDQAPAPAEALELVLQRTRALVAEGAQTGFNCHDGTWAEKLYANQADITRCLATLAALRAAPAGDVVEALRRAWTDFLDANPDDLTSPEDLPDHALMTCDQFVDYARTALSAQGWRDMSSAPKDGTHILACRAGETPVVIVRWQSNGWRDEASGYNFLTHWMPRPVTPYAPTAQGGV